MISMNIILDGDNAWPDLKGKEIIHMANGAPPIQVAVLKGGLASGRPSVALRIDLPDGRFLIAETSARLFCTAARAIQNRHPDLFEGD
jgi:hypothetical protein